MAGMSIPQRKPVRELPWRLSATLLVTALAGGGALAVWLLWTVADGLSAGTSAQENASLHLDAVKTGLTVAAGLGAAVTLLLAIRRQALNERAQRFAEEDAEKRQTLGERAQRHAEADAEQRRITDLYVRAVEQIGSDRAPVRLGGLYALERLGDNTPELRPTIMEVLCAYLRMPASGIPNEEIEVRVTAQRLILRHFRPGEDRFWGADQGVELNLGAATLVEFDAAGCRFGKANFEAAEFSAITDFGRVSWTDGADFKFAVFNDPAIFLSSTFEKEADFSYATFKSDVLFDGVDFVGEAGFGSATFTESVTFAETRFRGGVDFREAKSAPVQELPAGWQVSSEAEDGWFPIVQTK